MRLSRLRWVTGVIVAGWTLASAAESRSTVPVNSLRGNQPAGTRPIGTGVDARFVTEDEQDPIDAPRMNPELAPETNSKAGTHRHAKMEPTPLSPLARWGSGARIQRFALRKKSTAADSMDQPSSQSPSDADNVQIDLPETPRNFTESDSASDASVRARWSKSMRDRWENLQPIRVLSEWKGKPDQADGRVESRRLGALQWVRKDCSVKTAADAADSMVPIPDEDISNEGESSDDQIAETDRMPNGPASISQRRSAERTGERTAERTATGGQRVPGRPHGWAPGWARSALGKP